MIQIENNADLPCTFGNSRLFCMWPRTDDKLFVFLSFEQIGDLKSEASEHESIRYLIKPRCRRRGVSICCGLSHFNPLRLYCYFIFLFQKSLQLQLQFIFYYLKTQFDPFFLFRNLFRPNFIICQNDIWNSDKQFGKLFCFVL